MLAVASSFVCKYSHVLHGVHKPSKFGGVLYQADFLPAETVSVLGPAPRGVPVLSQTLPNLTHTQLCLLMVKKCWTFPHASVVRPCWSDLETIMAWQLSPSNMRTSSPVMLPALYLPLFGGCL